MSFRNDYFKYAESIDYDTSAFTSGFNFEDKTWVKIKSIFYEILENGMHGLFFSLYEDGQNPGDTISGDQV